MDTDSAAFSGEFKGLWEAEAPARQLWMALEAFSESIDALAAAKATELASKTLPLLEEEMKNRTRPMEELYVNWVNLHWGRIVLRTLLKVRDSLRILFDSCNSANAYGAALGSRAILEHVALLEYFSSKVPWKANRAVKKEDVIQFTKDIQRLSLGSRFDWDKLLSGGMKQLLASGQWSRPKGERIPDLSDLIGVLDQTLFNLGRLHAKGQIQFSYTVLCDVVHPSWGGDIVYAPRMYREMSADAKLGKHFRLLASLFCLPIVEVVGYLLTLSEALSKDQLSSVAWE
ncbi:MAG TPA: hypothetical protein VHR66_30620 [Gemmataceae bacterium]|jgi:hypothetical protein|nr:hypothetical protein [Gemmataceae bacterium]